MQNIQNIPEGACASIVFYHFVKNCGTLKYSDIESFAEIYIPDYNIYYDTIIGTLSLIKPTIEKYFKLIRKGIKWNKLPNGKHQRKFSKPILELQYLGKTEYGNIVAFNRCIMFLITGLWMDFDVDNLNKNGSLKIDTDMFNNYNNFISKFTFNVPYIGFVLYFDSSNKIKYYEPNELHVIFMLKTNIGLEIYDSNNVNILLFKEHYPAIIETDDIKIYNPIVWLN